MKLEGKADEIGELCRTPSFTLSRSHSDKEGERPAPVTSSGTTSISPACEIEKIYGCCTGNLIFVSVQPVILIIAGGT